MVYNVNILLEVLIPLNSFESYRIYMLCYYVLSFYIGILYRRKFFTWSKQSIPNRLISTAASISTPITVGALCKMWDIMSFATLGEDIIGNK